MYLDYFPIFRCNKQEPPFVLAKHSCCGRRTGITLPRVTVFSRWPLSVVRVPGTPNSYINIREIGAPQKYR
jgi:hypothetical protein